LALSILTDLGFETSPIPDWTFMLIFIILAILMVSRIHFPELKTIFSYRIPSVLLLGVLIFLAIWLTPQLVWLLTTTAYITFGVSRAAYRLLT
jgi:phosphatidylserine synthase